jgi:hypothetical protein
MTVDLVVVEEHGRELPFTFDELLRFHGGGSPGGVAIAFRALQRALPLLADGGRVARRDVHVRTAFGGPGARDGFEAVLRAVTDGRYVLDPSLARPALGLARERFVFVLTHGSGAVTLVLRDGFAGDELVTLARTDPRSPAQEARLTEVKEELCRRVMAQPADAVFDVE